MSKSKLSKTAGRRKGSGADRGGTIQAEAHPRHRQRAGFDRWPSPPELGHVGARLVGIRNSLMDHLQTGDSMPSAMKGDEREGVVRKFLGRVFPPPYRFGSGAIVGADNALSGQLDIVVEFPFLPSFPTVAGDERLYLAESAAVVIEVKSDLTGSWDDVLHSAAKVGPIRRSWIAHEATDPEGQTDKFDSSSSRIPFLVVAYRGPRKASALEALCKQTPICEPPDGILVIESGAYSGCAFNGWSCKAERAAGFLGFCLDVAWLASNVHRAAMDARSYVASMVAREVVHPNRKPRRVPAPGAWPTVR
jgi:hypothetical protein